MISLMKTYIVKYSITFSKDGCDDVVVEHQKSVREGRGFFDKDKDGWFVVQDQGTAESYVRVLYDNAEYNLMDVPRMVKELHEGIHDTKLRIFRNNAPSITREAKRKIVFSDRKRLLFFWFVLALVGFAPWFFAGEGYICEVGEVDERTLNFDFLLIAFMPLILHIIYIAIDLVKIDKE